MRANEAFSLLSCEDADTEEPVRILLVEDQPKLARAVSRGLEREGYAVDVAGRGDEALFQARVYEYDAVVLDVLLPGGNGFEVCQTLRDEGCWSPILMLTARDRVDDRIRGLDAGADDYLVKPAVLEVGDLVIDPATRAVTRADRSVELTAREFAVLEFLARRVGDVVTRTELIEHVWDRNFEGASNIVDVYVGYLRKKLERPFGRPLIRTVRGAGYVLDGR